MKANDLKTLLATTIAAQLPVLIKGAPGIGKSDIVTQAAAAAGTKLIISHPVVSDPTDYKGLPAAVDGKAEFLPFGDLRQLIEATEPTVFFLDDLGQAPAVVQAAAMQLLLARQVNGHKISEHVTFIAATNRREDRAGVTGILEPVKSRFATIVELQTDVEQWCSWAINNGMPVELVAFIRFRPTLLMDTEKPTNDIVNRPCPRTVAFVGKLLNVGIRSLEALAGAAGQGFATEFIGFLTMWEMLPSIDGILLDPASADVPSEPAALYAIATALAKMATKQNARKIITYADRMPREFSVLTIRDMLKHCPTAANNQAFIKWAAANEDLLS